jgi:general secretion pathway protein F
MAAYEYEALDGSGRKIRGVITGDSAKLVRQELRDQGLTPIKVESVRDSGGVGERVDRSGVPGKPIGSRQKLGTTDLAVITRQFATLLDSGLTIEVSLAGLVEQSESHRVKSILTGVRSMVMEGHTLADGLRSFPRAFPELYVASVAAGEQTGHLEQVLDRLADYTESQHDIRQKIGTALAYPILLTLVSLAIIVGLMTYVVPKVVRVFEDNEQALPLLTRGLISVSEFVQNYGLLVMLGFLIVLAITLVLLRYPGPKYAFHKMILGFPGLRRLSRSLNTARMARTLAILIGSGVPLLSALRSSSEVLMNVVMRGHLLQASKEVEQGASLSRALSRSKVFPALFTQMVSSGESSGRLDEMISKAARALEKESESRVAIVVSLFEPVMILIMGIVVLIIVLAILLPIIDLNQMIG